MFFINSYKSEIAIFENAHIAMSEELSKLMTYDFAAMEGIEIISSAREPISDYAVVLLVNGRIAYSMNVYSTEIKTTVCAAKDVIAFFREIVIEIANRLSTTGDGRIFLKPIVERLKIKHF